MSGVGDKCYSICSLYEDIMLVTLKLFSVNICVGVCGVELFPCYTIKSYLLLIGHDKNHITTFTVF